MIDMTYPAWDDDYAGEKLERAAIYVFWVDVKNVKPDFAESIRDWKYLAPAVRKKYRDEARALLNYMESKSD